MSYRKLTHTNDESVGVYSIMENDPSMEVLFQPHPDQQCKVSTSSSVLTSVELLCLAYAISLMLPNLDCQPTLQHSISSGSRVEIHPLRAFL